MIVPTLEIKTGTVLKLLDCHPLFVVLWDFSFFLHADSLWSRRRDHQSEIFLWRLPAILPPLYSEEAGYYANYVTRRHGRHVLREPPRPSGGGWRWVAQASWCWGSHKPWSGREEIKRSSQKAREIILRKKTQKKRKAPFFLDIFGNSHWSNMLESDSR